MADKIGALTAEREAQIRRSVNADYDYGDAERISGEAQELLTEIDRLRASVFGLRRERAEIRAALGDPMSENTLAGIAEALKQERDTLHEMKEVLYDALDHKVTEKRELRKELERLRAEVSGTANGSDAAESATPEATEKDKENISKGKRL